MTLATEIIEYNNALPVDRKQIGERLAVIINSYLASAKHKIWHAHPVWFIDGNPIVGYSSLKDGIRLMFWSGASFDEPLLQPGSGKFKDASITYNDISQLNEVDIKRWLNKTETIQWDYKNLVKRKGELRRLR